MTFRKKFYFSKTCYDWLGEETFRDMINEILEREFKDGDFYIGPAKGRDRGIDAQFLRPKEKQRVVQYKWREIANQPLTKHRAEILKEFEDWVEAQSKDDNVGEGLFVTNVSLSDKYRKLFQDIITKYSKNLPIRYWNFEEINFYLKKHDDLYVKYIEQLPNTIRQERDELRKKLEKLEAKKLLEKVSYSDLKKIEQGFQQLFISRELKRKYYFAFIYLLSPFYRDERDKLKREKLRKLFKITRREEESFIDELKKVSLIEITGGLITVKDRKRARKSLNETINKLKIDLGKIVNLLFE